VNSDSLKGGEFVRLAARAFATEWKMPYEGGSRSGQGPKESEMRYFPIACQRDSMVVAPASNGFGPSPGERTERHE
jgi:hypothetical protein